jgi:16S rRNA (adenine(1408)-N(1))-methyltransferase
VVVDVGTGDGRAVLARARRWPGELILGVDASADAMREASRRAAAAPSRGGLPNARFFVEAAEALPGPLAGAADLVTVTMPWGSLLRGVLGQDTAVLRGLAGLLAEDGRLEALVSVTPRDGLAGIAELAPGHREAIAIAAGAVGLHLVTFRPATGEEVAATGSSWARRLGPRPVWRLATVRACDRATSSSSA